jgi:chromosome segregation ATPase
VIFGTLSFAVGVGFGAILFSKSNWNLSNLRPTYESIAAHFANWAQTTPLAISAPDISVSQTANQLRSIGTELNSLRQDMRSLAGELAQIREAQEHLTAAQAELVRKSQSTSEVRDNRGEAAQAELVRKRPDSRTNRGKRSTASPPHP